MSRLARRRHRCRSRRAGGGRVRQPHRGGLARCSGPGGRPGMRRRAAQGRCATLVLHERDEAREARLFEPVVAALDDITPRLEVTRPGTCALAMRGPSRYFGGDAAVADLVHERLAEVVAERTDVRVGVADGPSPPSSPPAQPIPPVSSRVARSPGFRSDEGRRPRTPRAGRRASPSRGAHARGVR